MSDKKDFIKIIPLGGLDGIGKNMTAIRFKDEIILIDSGIAFPEHSMLGIRKILPNFDYIKKNQSFIKAIILTHAHEDHIGGLPYLLEEINAPIYGTKLTLAFAKERLKAKQRWKKCNFIEINPRKYFQIGFFKIEPLHVCHSIPEGVALNIETPIGRIIHTGDFRIDTNPIDGKLTDLKRFKELGEQGVLLLMSDSTNADIAGKTKSESDVKNFFINSFQKVKGRIIVSCFASHIHRIQSIINVAQKLKKKVVIIGPAILDNITIAQNLGYLTIPESILISPDQLKNFPDDKIIIITTGTQGEHHSVLNKISLKYYKNLCLKNNDSIFISAKPIPGNEKDVYKTIDNLLKKGVDVYYTNSADIHASGHGFADELDTIIKLTKPKYMIPIHGDYRHMVAHKKIALFNKIPEDNILLLNNGNIVQFNKNNIKIIKKASDLPALLDGTYWASPNDLILKERHDISKNGILIITYLIKNIENKIISSASIESKGFIYETEKIILNDLKNVAEHAFNSISALLDIDKLEVSKYVVSEIGEFVFNKLKRRPTIIPIFVNS